MKKLTQRIKGFAPRTACRATRALSTQRAAILRRTTRILTGNTGSGYVDMAVVILISVVVGALLLAGLYALFGDTVLPAVTRKINDMFSYGR